MTHPPALDRRQLIATAGAALAATAAPPAAEAAWRAADTLYAHGAVWNRELPGLAGRLNLAFDLRVNLETGTGAGSAGDPVYPEAGFHFAVTEILRTRVQGEDRVVLDGVVTEEPVRVVEAGVDPHAVQSYMFGQSPATVDYECSGR